jgi:hypothetical protein
MVPSLLPSPVISSLIVRYSGPPFPWATLTTHDWPAKNSVRSGGAATELTDQRANRAFLEEAARADDHRREIAVGVAPDARCVRPGRVIGGDDFQRRRRVDVVEYERPQTPRFCPAR